MRGVFILFFILLLSNTYNLKGQFVPNRSFEHGIDSLDIEHWHKHGSKGEISRIQFLVFRGDTIWPMSGNYMLLLANPNEDEFPDKSVDIKFECGRVIISSFYFSKYTYYSDSINERVFVFFSRLTYSNEQEQAINSSLIPVSPNNYWFRPMSNSWLFSSLNTAKLPADSCYISISFDPVIPFSKESFALFDNFQLRGEASGGLSVPLYNEKLSTFPNPFTDKLSISTYLRGTGRVMDYLGRELKQFTISQSPFELDLSDLPAGVYFVDISSWGGTRHTIKVIKQ